MTLEVPGLIRIVSEGYTSQEVGLLELTACVKAWHEEPLFNLDDRSLAGSQQALARLTQATLVSVVQTLKELVVELSHERKARLLARDLLDLDQKVVSVGLIFIVKELKE